MKKTLLFSLLVGFIGSVLAQPSIDAERGRIAVERVRAQAAFAVEDAACYKQFWVNACLDEVKSRRVVILSDLRRQEVALNDQERKAQGAEQLQKIEEKQSLAKQQAEANARTVAANKVYAKSERDEKRTPGSGSPDIAKLAKAEAEVKAKAQANKASALNRVLANQAKLATRNEKQALSAQEVQKFEAKQRRAKERQDKNKAAKGGKTNAPPLPPAPAL
jgi:colicin import membrane protein